MKTTRKLVVTCLALLTGASVAGSITSTVAWFEYATRAQVAYTGTTSHCSKLLRISLALILALSESLYCCFLSIPSRI